jgi:hypothetical protein
MARGIFVKGFEMKSASNWSMSKLETKLSELNGKIDPEFSIGDTELDNVLDEVLAGLSDGKAIVVIDDPVEESSSEAAESAGEDAAPKKKAKAAPKEPKPAKEKSESSKGSSDNVKVKAAKDTPRDKYGNREGSQAAAINACLSKKPTTLQAIAETTGYKLQRVKDHFKWLEKHGYAERVGDDKIKATGQTAKDRVAEQPA